MRTGDACPDHGSIAPLLLRLTHDGGEVRHGVMRVPPGGAGMADALQLCGERQSDAQWRVANLCRIAWRGEAQGWRLRNDSYTLVCARNGERIPVGATVTVAVGDTLELGLLRFVLVQEEGGSCQKIPTGPEPAGQRPTASGPASNEVSFADGLDLRELCGSRDLASDGGQRPSDPHADPFGVLDIAGARSRTSTDALDALLSERRRSEARPPPAVPAPLGTELTAPELDELHDEFVRVVRDPGQLAGRSDWEGVVVLGAEAAPTLEDLSRHATSYPLLRDILLPRESIDQVIDAFQPLAPSGLLDAEPVPDVLALFAPELAREAKLPLPSLTRREHHALSPDSHVRIGPAHLADGDGMTDRDGMGEGGDAA